MRCLLLLPLPLPPPPPLPPPLLLLLLLLLLPPPPLPAGLGLELSGAHTGTALGSSGCAGCAWLRARAQYTQRGRPCAAIHGEFQ